MLLQLYIINNYLQTRSNLILNNQKILHLFPVLNNFSQCLSNIKLLFIILSHYLFIYNYYHIE